MTGLLPTALLSTDSGLSRQALTASQEPSQHEEALHLQASGRKTQSMTRHSAEVLTWSIRTPLLAREAALWPTRPHLLSCWAVNRQLKLEKMRQKPQGVDPGDLWEEKGHPWGVVPIEMGENFPIRNAPNPIVPP